LDAIVPFLFFSIVETIGAFGRLDGCALAVEFVITGLDPAIHQATATWMPGSSPGMTIWEPIKGQHNI
jgi:hypothetical protein